MSTSAQSPSPASADASESPAIDQYRREVERIASKLAVGELDEVQPKVKVGQLKLFTDGNLDKRYLKLTDQTELLADLVEELEDAIVEFVKTVPLAAYDTGISDTDRFLDWFTQSRRLTDEEFDGVTCQRCRCRVEEVARSRRTEHVWFQHLRTATEAKLLTVDQARVAGGILRANPIQVETVLHTRHFVDEETALPAMVLFFPVQAETRTAVIEPEADRLLQMVRKNHVTIEDVEAVWNADQWDREFDATAPPNEDDEPFSVDQLCEELIEVGLLAIEVSA